MPLRIGDTFAGYRVLRLLGSGGMGEVYLAQHPRLPRQDALKILRPDVSNDASFRERFVREADLAATLTHPHIVGVYDRGEHDGHLWIAMEYIDGVDAGQLMEQRYPAGMPVEDVAAIVTAVASALDYSHKRGLLHRDVKPANIMLAHLDDPEERRIILGDFGIARPVDAPNGLTATNMTVGTVAYSAPEQLLGEDIDGRADEYALAATAYHLLTGSPVFTDSNPAVVISRHLNSDPPALADARPELARLDPVLRAGLAKRPDERFGRCIDLARAFSEQTALAAAPTPAAPTTPAPLGLALPAAPPANIKPALTRKKSAVWVVVATVGILALVGGALLAWRPWETRHVAGGSAAESLKPSTATMPPPEPVPTTTTAEPPPPPTFSPKSIDRVLLTPDQLTSILGVEVTDNPSSGGTGVLTLTSSAYGMSDHASQVTPRSCVGVVFTGEHDVYADAAPSEIKSQAFGNL